MKEGYWVIRTYEAGAIVEKTKYFVPGSRPTGKIRKKDRDAARKQEQNEYSAQKDIARILNANFTAGDLFVTLDYSDEGLDKIMSWGRGKGLPVDNLDEAARMDAIWECANHELTNAMRRTKARTDRQGLTLKAIYITADMDGETGEAVRVHHHLVINREALPAIIGAWEKHGMGGVDWRTLWDNQEDRTPVAEYMIRQVRRIPDAKKYRTTRKTLERPRPKDRIAISDAELKVPKGAKLLYRGEFKPGRPQYIRYAKQKPHDRR